MNRLRQIVLMGALALLVACPAWAGSKIDLNQSGGGTTELGGTGSAANVTQITTMAGEAIADDVLKVEERGYYVSISTAATTVLKSGPGWLHNCVVLGGTAGAVTIYDNTAGSGTVIAATFTPPAGIYPLPFDVVFNVGATVVTAAASAITCSVR